MSIYVKAEVIAGCEGSNLQGADIIDFDLEELFGEERRALREELRV